MIGAALAGGLIDRTLATTLISAVAISMLVIPGLAKLGARIGSSPRGGTDAKAPEIPPDSEASRVIIVGYGRVGALIGDMLDRHAIPFIAVDSNAGVTSQARSDGKPVYYGDAARPEYLRRCGLETARAVVVTMDSTGGQRSGGRDDAPPRPDITLVARARDADHARALYGLGVTERCPRRSRRACSSRRRCWSTRRADGPRHRLDPREARRVPQAAGGRRRARAPPVDARAASGVNPTARLLSRVCERCGDEVVIARTEATYAMFPMLRYAR